MTSVKVNNIEYPVIEILGKIRNSNWDDRESKTIHLEMNYNEAISIFKDGTEWSIIDEWEEEGIDENSQETITIPHREEYDNSQFNVAGDITDHRDGTVSVTMGKMTDLEEAYELLYGGE